MLKRNLLAFPRLSLKAKLVLSYLVVALGAVLIMAIIIALAVQSYFNNAQLDSLRGAALYRAQSVSYYYQRAGSWGNIQQFRISPNDPVVLVITDVNGALISCSEPAYIYNNGNCTDPILQHALSDALKGQSEDGYLPIVTQHGTFSSLFVSVPITLNGHVIGAMFLSEPQIYPNAFPGQVNTSILITVLAVSLVVLFFSILFATRLTEPLMSLTEAAEQMKQGRYTQRVQPPKSQDEMELLAQTFNEMADTIEADVNELRRQEQARRELLANIAHDLTTPLTAIQGFSEALADDMISDPSARQETAQRIAREVLRLRRMVGDLQQMSSLESGHVRLDLAPLNLYSLVDETLAVIEPECEQHEISVHNEISSWIPLVLADSDRITQVLLNLLDNARRHTHAGGRISVGAQVKERNLQVWVSDTGSGIDPADLPHIFERFYRADRSRTGGTGGGSGLGLSIVKAIITAHGGSIQAESEKNKGTRISFTLPLVQQPPQLQPTSPQQSAGGTKISKVF
jgi:two-component system, OmpR family, sensor histidine kinase BaeS